ncbi:MAG: replication factor A [Methanosarcinaceae archaeon]|nr:replication factor A [Methanosarcinaceae archaeon]
MDEIDEIYNKLGGIISKDEFLERVNEKIELMSGLCDKKTAAMLVAHDLGVTDTGRDITKVADITADMGNVNFIAKVMSVFPVREFNRNDGSIGKVGNLIVADETGSIRLTLWDDKADMIMTKSIIAGQNVQVSGYAKEGYSGIEVNVGRNGVLIRTDEVVEAALKSQKIKDIKDGMGDINISGRVLDIWDVKTFARKDGSEGRVCNILIGDDTGKIRVTLWDDKSDFTKELNIDDSVVIINGYARENNFSQQVEIQVGTHSVIKKADTAVEYAETFVPIADIVPEEVYSIKGAVSGLGELREFTRDDGSLSMVSNIYVSDDSGRIRVALWAENATLVDELDIDTPIQIIDAFAKSGWNDEVELSVGNRSRVVIL